MMNNFFKSYRRGSRPATTLVELMVTLTLFTILGTASIMVMRNQLAMSKKIQRQAFLYSEAQNAMNQISSLVEQMAIDYEFYYDTKVLLTHGGTNGTRDGRAEDISLGYVSGADRWHTPYYGYYGQSFYHPGAGGPIDAGPFLDSGVTGYGVNCETPIAPDDDEYPDECPKDTPDVKEADLNLGTHPFSGIEDVYSEYANFDVGQMNAFCEVVSACTGGSTGDECECEGLSYNVVDELALINSDGDERIVIRLDVDSSDREDCSLDPTNASYRDCRLARLDLIGTDTGSDEIVDSWSCASNYCSAGISALPALSDFEPIVPSAIHISDLDFYISPLEDPYKAFSEEDEQIQPQVTIFMTVTLSSLASGNILGNIPSITLQNTVSTGVTQVIETYK